MTTTATLTRRNLLAGSAAAAAGAALASTGFAVADETPKTNRVCEILGIEKPLVQAVMFDMTNPELVAAVSNAGGLGFFSFTEVDQIQDVLALTDKPFGVAPYYNDDETAEALKELGINIVYVSSLGYPSDNYVPDTSTVTFWKDHGFTVVTKFVNATLEGALALEEAGADIIAVVGYGAGGCGPVVTATYPMLLSEFAGKVSVPMLAGGGVVDAATARAGAACGAEGAYVGTRFLVTEESNCCDAAKQIIIDTRAEDLTEVYTVYNGEVFALVPCSRSAMTEKFDEMLRSGATNEELRELAGTFAPFWIAMSTGNIDEYAVGMSRACSLITGFKGVQEIVDEISAPFMA